MLAHLKMLVASISATFGMSRLYDAVSLLLRGFFGFIPSPQNGLQQLKSSSSISKPNAKSNLNLPESKEAAAASSKPSAQGLQPSSTKAPRTVLFPSTLQIEALGSKLGGLPVACATDANFNLIPVKSNSAGNVVGWDFSTTDVHTTSWDEEVMHNNFSFEVPNSNARKDNGSNFFFSAARAAPAHAQYMTQIHTAVGQNHNLAVGNPAPVFPLSLDMGSFDFYTDIPPQSNTNVKNGKMVLRDPSQVQDGNFTPPYSVLDQQQQEEAVAARSDSVSSSYTGGTSELGYAAADSHSHPHYSHNDHTNNPQNEGYTLSFDDINLFGGSMIDGSHHATPSQAAPTPFTFAHDLISNPSDGSSDEAEIPLSAAQFGHIQQEQQHLQQQQQQQQHQQQQVQPLHIDGHLPRPEQHSLWNVSALPYDSPYESLTSVGSLSTAATAMQSLSPRSNVSAVSYSKSPESVEVEQIHLIRQSMDINGKQQRKKRKNSKRAITKATPTEFTCQECGAMFKIKGYLTRHLKKHAKTKAYTCPFYDPNSDAPCHPSGGFSRRDTYKTHLKARHFIYPPKTKCQNRGAVAGVCQGCGCEYDNNESWVEEHVQKGLCEGINSICYARNESDRERYDQELLEEEDLSLDLDLAELEHSPVYHNSMNLHLTLNPAAVMI